MELKATLRNRVDPGGFYVAATYVIVIVFVFAITAYTTKPSNVGLDWIPFVMFASPWYFLNPRLLLAGLILNVGLMYLLGTLLHTFWRHVANLSYGRRS